MFVDNETYSEARLLVYLYYLLPRLNFKSRIWIKNDLIKNLIELKYNIIRQFMVGGIY